MKNLNDSNRSEYQVNFVMTLNFSEQPAIELETKPPATTYLLAAVEVIIFNLSFLPGKFLQNVLIEDLAQDLLGYKLSVECDGSLCFLIALFLAFLKKNIIRGTW